MKIEIDFQKRYLVVFLLGVAVMLAGIVGVIAYNSGGPASFVGHSSEEIDLDLNGDGIYEVSLKDALNQGLIGGGGVSCEWKEMEYYDCDSSGNCRARLNMQTAANVGATSSCYFQKTDNNKYYFGYLHGEDFSDTSLENSWEVCRHLEGNHDTSGTETFSSGRYFDSTHKAYYYVCN